MAVPELDKFREKFPQYNDLDDVTIANKLATKYPDAYGDLPSKVGQIKQSQISPLEQEISQRPDMYNQAVQDIQNLPQTYNSVGSFFKPGSGLPIANILLNSVAGIGQRAESAIFNPFLRKQGRFQNPITAVKEGITGQQLGQLGDIGVQAGIPRPISAVGGLMGVGLAGGALSQMAGLNNKANNLMALQSTYGKKIGKNIIRWSTGMPDPAIENGMAKGWNKVLTPNNLDPAKPTRIAKNVLNNLDEISQKEYEAFGKVMDRINTGNIKGIDLFDTIQNELVKNGYLDASYNPTAKIRGDIVNKIEDMLVNAEKNMKPTDNIPVGVVQSFKDILKKKVPEANWIGKKRSLTAEQKLAKDLYNKFNEKIGYNAYGIEDTAYNQVKKDYSQFKNAEAQILNTFSEVTGQTVTPTADKVVGILQQHPTKAYEELGKLKDIGEFLKSKGYEDFYGKLMDWLTTQSAIVQPQQGGASLYPFRLLAESTKYLSRQALRSGVPTKIGNTGKVINYTNLIPAVLGKSTQLNSQSQ